MNHLFGFTFLMLCFSQIYISAQPTSKGINILIQPTPLLRYGDIAGWVFHVVGNGIWKTADASNISGNS